MIAPAFAGPCPCVELDDVTSEGGGPGRAALPALPEGDCGALVPLVPLGDARAQVEPALLPRAVQAQGGEGQEEEAMPPLVLSLFPGIDLLGRAFEEEGFCVVRGPDRVWGGDVHKFHPPRGVFDLVIGGPPCKGESPLAHLNGNAGQSLRGEFIRVTKETDARAFLMEAVRPHRTLALEFGAGSRDWTTHICALSPRWIGELQSRRRFFHSNLRLERFLRVAALEPVEFRYAVRAANRASGKGSVRRRMASYPLAEMKRLQGVPDLELPGFTVRGQEEAIGNGVPMCVGREIARAVRLALEVSREG